MGEFTQSLLKLTEFPFSYSLMGLLALIFGQGANLEQLSFTKIGPLLILMGFVATTLSICDPVGAIQRLILKGTGEWWIESTPDGLVKKKIFGLRIGDLFRLPYMFAIAYPPERLKSRYRHVDWDRLNFNWSSDFAGGKIDVDRKDYVTQPTRDELNKIDMDDIVDINDLLGGLKEQAVRTKWITAEVDRITALVYFIIVISVFIGATLLYPVFLQKFAQVFQNNVTTKLGILFFSSLALVAVSYMLILRIKGLQRKALVVFRYLTALEAIKTSKEREEYKTNFQDIERYLDNNDWTLAEYWVKRVQLSYTEFVVGELKA